MGVYEKKLLDYMYSRDFIRTFLGKCPECEARIWDIGEEYNPEKGYIKAKFICNCGKKFKKIVFSKSKGYKYRYPQGIVEYKEPTTKGSIKIIKQNRCYYEVTQDGVKKFDSFENPD